MSFARVHVQGTRTFNHQCVELSCTSQCNHACACPPCALQPFLPKSCTPALPVSGNSRPRMEGLTVVELLKLFCKTGLPVQHKTDFPQMQRLLVAFKDMQLEQARAFVQQAGHRPLLVSYANDATPVRARHRMSTGSTSSQRPAAWRRSVSSLNALVQQVYLRCLDATGLPSSTCIMREPLHLCHGHDGAAVFACSREFCADLRQMGHDGIAIAHYNFDGALCAYLGRRFRALHLKRAIERKPVVRAAGGDPKMLHLKEWQVVTQCVSHMAHNALKWAMWECYPAVEHLEELWQLFAAAKNSSAALQKALPNWLIGVLDFLPPRLLPSPEVTQTVWATLGASPEQVEQLACQWMVHWDEAKGKLFISDLCRHDTNLMGEVASMITMLLPIQSYSKSRWMTVAVACRKLCLCRLLGLDALVEFVLKTHGTDDFYLGGYRTLQDKDRKAFSVVCGLVGYLPDTILSMMAEDARGVRHVAEWKAAAQEEYTQLASWDLQHWKQITSSGLAGPTTARCLQEKVMQGALVAWSFLHHEAFQPMCKLPWSLAIGDIEANLRELQISPEATELTTWKIQALLQQPTQNFQEIVQGVRLLREVGWSTNSVEQAHASCTLMKRQHPDYDKPTLLIRAGLHTLRRLIPGLDEGTKTVLKLRHQLDKLTSKRPDLVSAKCMYIKALIEAAKDRSRRQGLPLTHAFVHRIVKNSGRRWQQLPPHQQQQFKDKAEEFRAHLAHSQAEEREVLAQKLLLAAMRAEEDLVKSRDRPLNFSACTLTDRDIAVWQRNYDRLAPKGAQGWERRWEVGQSAPRPLQEHEEAELDNLEPVTDTAATEPAPPWVSMVAQLREQIRPCGLKFLNEDGTETVVKVLFAKQRNPLEVHCVLLHPAEPLEPDPRPAHDPSFEQFLVDFRQQFAMRNPPELVGWRDLPRAPIAEVQFIPHLVFRPGHRLCSDFDALPLQTVIECQVHKETKATTTEGSKTRSQSQGSSHHQPMDTQFPAMKKLCLAADEASGAASSGIDAEDEPVFGELLSKAIHEDEAEAEKLFDEMEDARVEPVGYVGMRLTHFKCARRSAKASDRAVGHMWSGWQGQVTRHSEASRWCVASSLQQTMHFDWALGDEEAKTLCEAWASRMQYLFNSKQEGLMESEAAMEETLNRYVEAPEFVALADRNEEPWKFHVERIRRMKPVL